MAVHVLRRAVSLCALLLAAAPPSRCGDVALAGTQEFKQGAACYDAKDYACAVTLLEKSAALKHPGAEGRLGYMYYIAIGVAQNFTTAAAYFTRSSDQGYAFGQYWLGKLYRNGDGVMQSDAEALRLYGLAAAQGEMESQQSLGYMYSNGQGVAEDKVAALSWYLQAARQGFAKAQYNAGLLLTNGQGGVPQDAEQALVWNELAVQGTWPKAIKYRQRHGHLPHKRQRPDPELPSPGPVHGLGHHLGNLLQWPRYAHNRRRWRPAGVRLHTLPEWLLGQVLRGRTG